MLVTAAVVDVDDVLDVVSATVMAVKSVVVVVTSARTWSGGSSLRVGRPAMATPTTTPPATKSAARHGWTAIGQA